jgi:hypothetical protein
MTPERHGHVSTNTPHEFLDIRLCVRQAAPCLLPMQLDGSNHS